MVTKIKSFYCFIQNDENLVMVGFADTEIETQEYILLQKPVHVTEQEAKLGLNKIHITYKEQHQSAYGGIERCILQKDRVHLEVEPDVASLLGTESNIEITFAFHSPSLSELKLHLGMLFCDAPTVFESMI